jgi:hypothetical protein
MPREDAPYLKRELDERHREVMSKLLDIEKKMDAQEHEINNLKMWKSMLIGMAIVSNIFVVPVLLKLYL